MVGFYKHDIPAWMDGTEGLGDGAYRAYHVIVQLIMLNEGPIARNERGIAGRCNQPLRSFSKNLNELLAAGKLVIDEQGRIACPAITNFASMVARETIPAALRREILERDDHTCVYCQATDCSLEMDHVIPVSRGGLNTRTNLVTACLPCNREKGARTPTEWLQ